MEATRAPSRRSWIEREAARLAPMSMRPRTSFRARRGADRQCARAAGGTAAASMEAAAAAKEEEAAVEAVVEAVEEAVEAAVEAAGVGRNHRGEVSGSVRARLR